MPNWTQNIMVVRGTEIAVEYFLKKYIDSTGAFDFNKVIPEPKTKEECPEEYLIEEGKEEHTSSIKPWFDWYHWRCDHWGTKWNAACTMITPKSLCTTTRASKRVHGKTWYEVEITYDTAWSPPMPVIEKLQKEFHDTMERNDIWIEHYYLGEFSEFVGRVIGTNQEEYCECGDPKFKKMLIEDGWESEESFEEDYSDYVEKDK